MFAVSDNLSRKNNSSSIIITTKTIPWAHQVLVFSERTSDVDNIHERLLMSGVEAVAVHGGLDQEDRNNAIDAFKVSLLNKCLFLHL